MALILVSRSSNSLIERMLSAGRMRLSRLFDERTSPSGGRTKQAARALAMYFSWVLMMAATRLESWCQFCEQRLCGLSSYLVRSHEVLNRSNVQILDDL